MDSSDLYVGASVQAVFRVKNELYLRFTVYSHVCLRRWGKSGSDKMRCSCFIVLVTFLSFFPLVKGYCFWWSVFFILSSWQGGKTDSWCRYWAWFFFSSIHLFNWSSFMFDVSGKFEYCFFQKSNNRGFAWADPQTNSWQWVWLWWINHELG